MVETESLCCSPRDGPTALCLRSLGKQGPPVTCQLAEALAQPPEGQQGGGWGPTAGEERALPGPSSPSPQWREHSREFKAL